MFGIETMSSLDGKPRVAFADEEEEAEDLYEEEDMTTKWDTNKLITILINDFFYQTTFENSKYSS